MQSGIRTEIRIEDVSVCPMAQVSNHTGTTCQLVSRSVPDGESSAVVEDFIADADLDLGDRDIEKVFTYGAQSVYRTSHDKRVGCPCEQFDRLGFPIVEIRTTEGSMVVVSHMKTIDQLQRVIGELRDEYPKTAVHRLARSKEDDAYPNYSLFDITELTDRQKEVLETAYAMGYFQHPKQSNSGEVADALGINRSTFNQHLAAAQTKILDALLDSGAE